MDAIKALIDSVNGIVSMVAGVVQDSVNSVLGFFNDIFNKLKDLISSIPFIGWLQDKLGELIDSAMDKLGIRAALQRIGQAFRDLPFVKAVFDFLDALKQAFLDLLPRPRTWCRRSSTRSATTSR